MGIRGELFTQQIQAENRTYFFNVKENTRGDVFLQIVESKSVEGGSGFDRHAVVIFEDELQTFLQGFDDSLKFMEKNRKAKLKARAERATRKFSSERVPSSDRRRDDFRKSDFKKDSGHRDDRRDSRRSSAKPSGNRAGMFKKPKKIRAIKKND